MSTQVQLRRGTTLENQAFTGAEAELTYNTETKGLRIHDGGTLGGFEVPVLVAVQRPTAENNYTWYRKWSDGWVEQGGQYTGNEKTVALPVTMADSNYIVQYNKNTSPSYWATTHLCVQTRTTTSFTVSKYGDSASMLVGWQVSGMAA